MAEEKETIVHTDSGGGGGALLAVVLLIALVVVLFLFFGGTDLFQGGETQKVDADIKIDTPAPNTTPSN